MLFREVIFKLSRLSTRLRTLLQTRMSLIRDERLFTLHLDPNLVQPSRRKMWITSCFNKLHLVITDKFKLETFISLMRHFSPKVSLELSFMRF